MINADEHKKLLEQVIELERNSVNYFDVEKEFFLIDSDNLSKVRPKLYGYSIQRTGIYEDDNLTAEAIAGLDGRGAYVYVEVKGNKITIKQDLNGSWGIYLFRHGDYFALSNSFLRLVDHVKFKYPLTLNRDYCQHMMLVDLCSHSYSETAVNEIRLVPRNAILYLDTTNRQLEIELIDYKEHTVSLDSSEAMTILDNWVDLWSKVFRGIAQHTKFITADLSGGFDSRMSLFLMLYSGIDLNKIKIHSAKGVAHTFKEDYEIASKIATRYGFKLNLSLPNRQALNYSLADIWNLSSYAQQPFHKISYLNSEGKAVNKLYYITGHSGETIRGNWLRFNQSPKEFIESQVLKAGAYPSALSRELSQATSNIFESTFQVISKKYKIADEDSHYLVQYLYQETRARNHYGKEFCLHYFKNNIVLAPTLDPKLHTVKFDTPQCPDPRLLTALIYVRYKPDLLTFPFQGGRSIVSETIEYARKINEHFPRKDVAGATGGGGTSSICNRVIRRQKKFSPTARTILLFLETCCNVA